MDKKATLKFFLVTFIVSILFLSACGNSASPNGDGDDGDKVYTIKMASAVGDWTNLYTGAEDFKQAVEEKSEGRIKVELFPDSQLGDEREILESLQSGNVEMGYVSTITFNNFDEKITFLDLPFLFKDYDEAGKAIDGVIGDKIKEIMSENGVRPLALGHGEFRWINTSTKPVKTPADLQGLQFRVPLSKVLVDYYSSMGANPITMGNSEVYTALQQGVVNAYDSSGELALLQKFYESTKYSTVTNHNYYPHTISISEKVWGTLPEDLQEILEAEAIKTMEAEREAMKDAVAVNADKLQEVGIEIIELSDRDKEQWIEAGAPLYDKIKDVLGEELYQTVIDEKNKGFE